MGLGAPGEQVPGRFWRPQAREGSWVPEELTDGPLPSEVRPEPRPQPRRRGLPRTCGLREVTHQVPNVLTALEARVLGGREVRRLVTSAASWKGVEPARSDEGPIWIGVSGPRTPEVGSSHEKALEGRTQDPKSDWATAGASRTRSHPSRAPAVGMPVSQPGSRTKGNAQPQSESPPSDSATQAGEVRPAVPGRSPCRPTAPRGPPCSRTSKPLWLVRGTCTPVQMGSRPGVHLPEAH